MKKFFGEFKKFITRGNVVDMAVGVTVGSAFTAIVNGLSNNVLKPLINYFLALILGEDSLSNIYTYLKKVYVLDEAGLATTEVDLTKSIYIDWGAFINAILNFFIIAFVLFVIVRFMNRARERHSEFLGAINRGKLTKDEKAAMIAEGLNPKSEADIKAYRDAVVVKEAKKAEAEAAAKAEAEKAEAEKAAYIAGADDRQEALLKEIVELLKKNNA
jgi:large conductance mechanosensitive channel